jgi:hypothetical protein
MIVDDIEEIKRKLRTYTADEIEFNEPHFTSQLMLREGSREDVVRHLLNPDRLVYSCSEEDRYGDTRHILLFEVSGSRTLKLPVIFDIGNKKALYIITYIMRYRKWQSMIR